MFIVDGGINVPLVREELNSRPAAVRLCVPPSSDQYQHANHMTQKAKITCKSGDPIIQVTCNTSVTRAWHKILTLHICERIWEKGLLRAETEFLFLIAHNFKAVIATDLKPGITILQSLCCTCYKFRAPPFPVWLGNREYHKRSKIGRFLPPVGAPLLQIGR